MNQSGTRQVVYTVVDVWRGIAAGACCYRSLRSAREHAD